MITVAHSQGARLLGWLLGAALLLPLSVLARDTRTFQQALEAARDHDWQQLERHEQTLGPDLPVQAYLDFHRVLAELPDAGPERVLDYMLEYPDTPLARDLRQRALARYGEARRWDAIRTLTSTPPRTLTLQCHYYRAWFDEKPDAGAAAARRIWRSGHSRPAACTPLFELWADNGGLDDQQLHERIVLAFRAGNPALMRHLARRRDEQSPTVQQLQTLYHQPERIRDLAETLPRQHRPALAGAAVHRLAQKDPVAARSLLDSRSRSLGLEDEQVRASLEQRVVWYMTIRGMDESRQWRDQWLRDQGSADLLTQRARLAVRERDWTGLGAWIARLDTNTKRSARWQYWLGRARHEQGRPEAGDAALRRAAQQRSFYGFLAARRLGRNYPFNQRHPEPVDTESVTQHPALERVAWLRAAGENDLAVDEWRHQLYRSGASEHRAMAQLASEQDWPELAIIAALHSGNRDVLSWRFPGAFRENFQQIAKKHQLESWLLMAIARRESAFQPKARSSAGARGLMQLMPATARHTAHQLDEAPPSSADLLDPRTSIRLGGAHLAELLERYNGHRLKALAAYNAGAHHLERWLPEEALPFDVWIESISFRETRDYVQAVLAYRLILQSLHGDTTDGETLALLSPGEKDRIQQPVASDAGQQLTRR